MEDAVIRIQTAEIINFQNVENGKIKFSCDVKEDECDLSSDILGIYGQNGSGKTAFIHALSVLKSVISGEKLSDEVLDYMMMGKSFSALSFGLSIKKSGKVYRVIYEFLIRRTKDASIDEVMNKELERVVICNEKIRYSENINGKWTPLSTLIDSDVLNEKTLFKPQKNIKEITRNNKNYLSDLLVAKKIAFKESSSFIFSDEMRKISSDIGGVWSILGWIRRYGMRNLYIIGTRGWGPINLNFGLPLYFKIEKESQVAIGAQILNIGEPTIFPKKTYEVIREAVKALNIVIGSIIPEMKVELNEVGTQQMKDGEEGILAELVSVRNNKRISIKNESEGIKKLIAILNMLAATYNNSSMTLAIDELDAGIFEYLLGEILQVFSQNGKGQLIFTSHNLRPLETLDKTSIVFTTTNPQNRYVRMKNVKNNNNLRDFYYHDIILGGQKEELYDKTNSVEIAYAMKKAGAINA